MALETQAEEAWRKKVESMSEADRKIYFNKLSMRQEEELVQMERAKGNLAWRVAREYDVIVIPKTGRQMWLVDCKFSANHEFIIDSGDITKIKAIADEMQQRLGLPVRVRFDMWFPRTRSKNNRRYVDITPVDIGWSVKCVKTALKILTSRVKKGSAEERP